MSAAVGEGSGERVRREGFAVVRAVLMRPLLLHSSPAPRLPRRRRVVHLEFAAAPLPHGLEWRA